jgi:Fe-S-cluster containining protein
MNKKLEEIYASLPGVMCKGLCHDSCGVIPIAPIERENMAEYTGKKVKCDPTIVIGLHSKHRVLRPKDDELNCPYLKDKRCSIHPARPLVCRMYGVVSGMPCPHGCVSTMKPLTNEEAHDIIEAVANIKTK